MKPFPSLDRPVIAGAGPGGVVAALRLAQLGQPCLLLEKERFPRDKICGDAFSGKVGEVLRRVAPDFLQDFQQGPGENLGTWGVRFVAPNGHALDVPFKTTVEPETPAPGFLSRRQDFDARLAELARHEPLIELREGCAIRHASRESETIHLELADGRCIQTPLLIGADGAQSVVARELAGHRLHRRHHSAGLRQYWAGVEGLHPENYIELHFLRGLTPGYCWIFPLSDGRANVGLGLRSDVVKRRRANLKAILQETLTHHPDLAPRFRQAQALESPRGFGLPMGSWRRSMSGPGWLLVGDAASLIDPFTGEGIGNAMLSGLCAAETAQAALCQTPPGRLPSAQALAAYDAAVWRRLGAELQLSARLQQLAAYPWLLNWVINKARRSPTVQATISVMFEDIDLRSRFRDPRFYFQLLWN